MIMKIGRAVARAENLSEPRQALRRSCLAALLVPVVFLAACGGDGSSSPSSSGSSAPTSSVSGTVATGSPAANVIVSAYEPSGSICGSATTAADGSYTLAGSCTLPYLLAAPTAQGLLMTPVMSGQAGGTITPITTAIFGLAAGNISMTASAASLAAPLSALSPTQLSAAQTSIVAALTTLFPSYTAWSGFNPFASFTANHTGIDGIIDQLTMQQAAAGSFTFANSVTSQAITVTANANGAPTVGAVTSTSSGSGSNGSGSSGSGSDGSGSSGSGSSGSGSDGSGSSGSGSSGSGSSGSGSSGSGSSGSSGASGSGTGVPPVLHCAP